MDQEKRTRGARDGGRQEVGEGRGTTESGQCVILRRLRKTRRPPARFASDEDLKIEGRRRMAEGRMPIGPSATLFSIRPSLCLRTPGRGLKPGEPGGAGFATLHLGGTARALDRTEVRIGGARKKG